MDFTLTPISRLDQAGLARLARLHSDIMHTLLADLGAPLVLRYYEVAQADSSVLGLCAVSESGDLLGWAMGSPAPTMLNARLRQPLAWFAIQLIRLVFTHPRVLVELIRSVFSTNEANNLQPGQIELTYIGVATQAQGRGIGKAILTAFIDQARSAGFTSIALSVETDNLPAITLYTKCAFQITKTFHEGRFMRHRMEYQLV